MIDSMLTPVHILSFEDIDGTELFRILSNAAGTITDLHVVAVTDTAPIEKKDQLLQSLSRLCDLTIFNTVRPNPLCDDIMSMMQEVKASQADVIIGIGGGSVMDSAKALAMLVTNGGELEAYLGNTPQRTIEKKSLPLVLLPTTAGTGSEVTKVGVYCDQSGRKYTLGSPHMLAHTAVLVGSFIDRMPPTLCAATGLDALDHALESIWNKNATDITRRAGEQAAIDVLSWLPPMYKLAQGKSIDRQVQMNMLKSATLAGITFSITGTAAGHAISFILSEDWHVPHGMACAFTLLEILDYSLENQQTMQSLATISKHFHPEITDAKELVKTLRNQIATLMNDMCIPTHFSEIGVETDLGDISKRFERSMTDPKMGNQVPTMDYDRLLKILGGKL